MSTTFDDRKSAFENKFAHDQQLQFRVEAKACKAFGLWIASQMGMNDADSLNYANNMVVANLDEPGLDDVIDMGMADLTKHGQTPSRNTLKAQLDQCVNDAKNTVMSQIQNG